MLWFCQVDCTCQSVTNTNFKIKIIKYELFSDLYLWTQNFGIELNCKPLFLLLTPVWYDGLPVEVMRPEPKWIETTNKNKNTRVLAHKLKCMYKPLCG